MANENTDKQLIEENEVVSEKEPEQKVILDISVKMIEDGRIMIDLKNDESEEISLILIDNVLKQAYESIHEQRLVEAVLKSFKEKL